MFDGHSNYVRGICFFDNYMCSASEDHTVRIWDLSEIWALIRQRMEGASSDFESHKPEPIQILKGHSAGVWCILEVPPRPLFAPSACLPPQPTRAANRTKLGLSALTRDKLCCPRVDTETTQSAHMLCSLWWVDNGTFVGGREYLDGFG